MKKLLLILFVYKKYVSTIFMKSEISRFTKLRCLGLPRNIELPDQYLDTLFEHYGKKQLTLNSYDEVIIDVTRMHNNGTLNENFKYKFDDNNRKDFVKYFENNRDKIRNLLADNGCSFYTCTNNDPVSKILSIIVGEPYYEYMFDEGDGNYSKVKVCYYLKCLKSPVVTSKCFIKGKYYDVTFNSLTQELKDCDENVKLVLENSGVGYRGYYCLQYDVRFKK